MQQPQDTDTDHDWGIISHGDVALMKRILDAAMAIFEPPLRLLEIGLASGETARGIYRHVTASGHALDYYGLDCVHFEPFLPRCTLFEGDSQYIFESVQVPGGLHILFIDGCHCVNHAMLDFLHYSPLVVIGGYVLFHDTNPSLSWQGQIHHGHGPHTPSFGRAVRSAIQKLGLMNGNRKDYELIGENLSGDKYGMMAFIKIA